MSTKDPIFIAILRGLYTAVGMGGLMFLTVLSTTNDTRAALIAAGLAFLGALGFRGGVEGAIDQRKGPRPEVNIPPEFGVEIAAATARHRMVIPGVELGHDDDDYHFGWQDGKEHRGPTPDVCNICVRPRA